MQFKNAFLWVMITALTSFSPSFCMEPSAQLQYLETCLLGSAKDPLASPGLSSDASGRSRVPSLAPDDSPQKLVHQDPVLPKLRNRVPVYFPFTHVLDSRENFEIYVRTSLPQVCNERFRQMYQDFHAAPTEEIAIIELGSKRQINTPDAHGWTRLHYLVLTNELSEQERTFLVRELLNSGANPNIGDKLGITPLHLAVYSCNVELVKLLCLPNFLRDRERFLRDKRALLQPDNRALLIKDKEGLTPLHWAVFLEYEELTIPLEYYNLN